MKSLLQYSILFFLINHHLYAQSNGSISGRVITTSGAGLPDAIISVKSSDITTLTQADGSFQLQNLPVGSITLQVHKLGYKNEVRTLELTPEVPNATVTITLSTSQIALQEVEVFGRKETSYKSEYSFIGTKTASRVLEVPQTISTVTKELMDDQQAFRLTDVVRNIAGVNQFSHYDDLTVRGFRNGYESGFRLINGLRSGFSYGNGFFRVPLTVNLERIEVLKGPGAALYGDINPGGTVNMVTKKPLQENRKAINFSVGSFNTTRTALDFTGPLNEDKSLLYRLNIGYEDSETFRDVIDSRSLLIAPSITFLPTDKTSINAELVYSSYNGYLDRGLPIQGGDLYALPFSFALNQPSDYFKVNDFYLNASVNHQFTPAFSFNASYLKFTYSEDLSEHRTLNTFADAPQNTVMNMRYFARQAEEYTDNLAAYFTLHGKTGALQHKLVWGVDYVNFNTDKSSATWEARQKTVNGQVVPLTFDLTNPVYELQDPGTYIRRPTPQFFIDYINAVYSTTGLYLQDQVKLAARLNLLLGGRYELFQDKRNYGDGSEKIKQQIFLPRLGLTYALRDNLNYFASYSQGFRPQKPEFIKFPERYGRTSPFGNESSYQVETGLKGEFLNKAVLGTVAVYHIQKENVLVNTGQVSPEGNPQYRQTGKAWSRGAEMEITGNLTPNLSLHANYAYNHTKIAESDIPGETGQRAPNAPEHTAGLWSKYTFTLPSVRGLGVGLGGSYVSQRRMENQVNTTTTGELFWAHWPSYAIVNAAVFYHLNKFRFTLNFNNLTNKKYFVGGYDYFRSSPGAPRHYLATIGYAF